MMVIRSSQPSVEVLLDRLMLTPTSTSHAVDAGYLVSWGNAIALHNLEHVPNFLQFRGVKSLARRGPIGYDSEKMFALNYELSSTSR